MNFNTKEYKNLIDMVCNSTLQPTFKKFLLLESTFRYAIKKEYPQISKKAIKIFLPFPTIYLHKAGFHLYTSTKTTHGSILNKEANRKIQLFSTQWDSKEICKTINQCQPSFFLFCFGNIVIFQKMVSMLVCNKFVIILKELINILNVSVLISNAVNTNIYRFKEVTP